MELELETKKEKAIKQQNPEMSQNSSNVSANINESLGQLNDEQLETEVNQQKILYVTERRKYTNENLRESERQFECCVCQKIPLYQQSCVECGERVCRGCEKDILKSGENKCPSEACKESGEVMKLEAVKYNVHFLKVLQLFK